jgi:putative membrane protein
VLVKNYFITNKKSLKMLAQIFIAFIAVLHIYILWMEMFAWETRGKVVFKNALAPELFTPTKGLAANQGLYNGFLAAGLIWSLLISDPTWQTNVATFFLGCVAVAGIYGAMTADKKILFVQTIPATIALILLYFVK